MDSAIDFVVLWVDGDDPEWQEEFFNAKGLKGDSRICRYRDWDNLQYMFRAFEKFTPWVNKIHFVTYGHLPKWLNIDHPKLNIVNHEDIIDSENLPVFNSRAIEVNIHKIEGLAEKFVYFNDDMFILKPLSTTAFFKKGLPVCTAMLDVVHEGKTAHAVMNNIEVINKHFNAKTSTSGRKRAMVLQHPKKWLNPRYGSKMFYTLALLLWPKHTGFKTYHLAYPYLKSTFIEVWENEEKLLNQVSASKFRKSSDINQYLFRYWQMVKGTFIAESYKRSFKKRKYMEVQNRKRAEFASRRIASKQYEMLCVNDDVTDEDFDYCKNVINEALHSIMPEKSSFEI